MSILPFLLALAPLSAPHLSAARAEKPPVLDGSLDEAVWKAAPASDAFTQKLPEGGKSPGERTVVRILYDHEALYVGIECEQRKSTVIGRLTRRDRQVEADMVTVALDTRGDGKSALEFGVNPAGVLSDGIHFNDTDWSQDWDENWEAKTAVTSRGWSAEFRIPLRVLRFSARPVQSWGLQVKRYTSMIQELDEWAYIPRETAGEVSHYGRLDNLVGLESKSPFELRPFIVGTLRHYDPHPSGGELARGFRFIPSAGLDLKWHISQALTLDATIFPDFGQVEADQVILNLTTFEQYYPEKRAFFLEGAEAFSTPLQLLYTRRIGRAPEVPELVDTGDPKTTEQLIHNPVPSTIFGAAKLVGEIGGHFTVGELVAITGKQTVDAQIPGHKPVDRLADPLTTYKVLRIKREIGDNAHIGLTAMATNRLETLADYPVLEGIGPRGRSGMLCPSGDGVALGERCFHDAYVGSVDGRWRSASGDYVVSAQAIATMIQHGPTRTLLDGTEIKSGDIGPGATVVAAKEGGKVTFRAEYEGQGRKVDYNDLGYMQRQNMHRARGVVEFRSVDPWKATLETHTGLEYLERDNLDLLNQQRALELYTSIRFKNFWGLFAGVGARQAHYDDREVGDGAALQRPGSIYVESWVGTDQRKRVSLGLWSMASLVDRGFGFQGDAQLSFRILPQFDVDLLPTWLYSAGEPRYFDTSDDGSKYLFGRLRAQSLGLTLRSTYTFTPRLTLQAYAQLFLDAGRYSECSSAPARGKGQVIHIADLAPRACPGAPGDLDDPMLENPSFESGTFNASLVLRWEYRLGSTLYVVYTHGQNDELTPLTRDGAGFDFRHVRPRAAEDDLLVKLSYWWGG